MNSANFRISQRFRLSSNIATAALHHPHGRHGSHYSAFSKNGTHNRRYSKISKYSKRLLEVAHEGDHHNNLLEVPGTGRGNLNQQDMNRSKSHHHLRPSEVIEHHSHNLNNNNNSPNNNHEDGGGSYAFVNLKTNGYSHVDIAEIRKSIAITEK